MASIALISDGKVVNVIDSTMEIAERLFSQQTLLDVTKGPACGPGWDWDGKGFVAPPTPEIPVDVRRKALVDAIQDHLDREAQRLGYDGILSMASYAASEHPVYGPEGVAAVKWRDACWNEGYRIQGEIAEGNVKEPTPAEIVAMLPASPLA